MGVFIIPMERRAHVCAAKVQEDDLEYKLNYPEVKDGWKDILKHMLGQKGATEEFLKDYLRQSMDGDTRAPEMLHETPAQKFAFGQAANEVYDKLAGSLDVEDFVNATSKCMNRFMGKDYLFNNNKLYCSQVDQELFSRLNEYTSHDMLTVLLDRVYHRTVDRLHSLIKWKQNIDAYLIANPVMDERYQTLDSHPSLTSRSKHFGQKCDRLRKQKTRVEVEISKLREEVSILGKYLLDYRDIFESITGVFEKPNVDMSAKAKLLANHDQVRLEKLLFTTQENKDVVSGLTQNKIEAYILSEIVHRHKYFSIRVLNQNLKLLPNSIYTKYLSNTSTRFFTRFDFTSTRLRAEHPSTPDRVFNLSSISLDPSPHKYLVNFYEYLLNTTGQANEYLKITCSTRRLTNLLISKDSLSILGHTLRLDDQQISRNFADILQLPHPTSIFTEAPNFPSFVFILIADCLQSFPQEVFSAKVKLPTDYTENIGDELTLTPLEKILNDQKVLKYWVELLTEVEKLDLFTQQVEELFTKLTLVQNEFLQFEDFYSPTKVLDINAISRGIKYRDRQEGQRGLLFSYLSLGESIKVKRAFWIKEGLLFKVTQKQPNEHYSTQLLKDQIRHPQIDNWLQLVLSLDSAEMKYDLSKFTDDLLEKVGVRTDQLKREKKLITLTMSSYVKLFMLRGRTASLKLISYFNFARSVQKAINLRFLATVEEGRQSEEWSQNSTPQSYRREDFLKLARMFDPKEYEKLRKIFDDEVTLSTPQELLGFDDFNTKFSRLITRPDYKAFAYTNPSKGGYLGGVVLGMDFDIQKEDYGMDPNNQQADNLDTKLAPENPFAEDVIEFKNISEILLEAGKLKTCPFAEVRDSNGIRVVYDAAIHDFFDVINDLALLASFFLENELAYYQDDQFEDLDLQFEDDQLGTTTTQKNVHVRVSRFDELFNYEYLFTRLMEHECLYQAAKADLTKVLFGLSEHVSDPRESVKLFDLLTDVMSRRPQFDLGKYKYGNQNTVEWLHRITLSRSESASNKAEMVNLVTTLFDNYRLETQYLIGLKDVLQSLISHQMNIFEKIETILKAFEVFQSSSKSEQTEDLDQFKPKVWTEQIRQVVKTIDNSSAVLSKTYMCPSQLDRSTFSSFLFDFHYKRQIEEYLDLSDEHKVDFIGCLNDFINGLTGRYTFFIEQSIRTLVVGEASAQVMALFEGNGLGDDLLMFEGEALPTPENCFSVLATTYSFFKGQARTTNLTTFDPIEGVNILDKEAFIQQANRYYAFLLNFGLSMDIRESLPSLGHYSTISKAIIDIISPVYESLSKNAKFEKPEDILNTQGNFLSRLMDFGEVCSYTLDDVLVILKVDLAIGANSISHLGRVKSLKNLLDCVLIHLSINVQLNTLGDRLAEAETIMHLTRIMTSKESVFDHIYRFQLGKKSETPKYILKELKAEFTKGEYSFKYFLWAYDMPFYEITNVYLQSIKKTIYVSPFDMIKGVVAKVSQLMGSGEAEEKNRLESITLDNDLGMYFTEHSISQQDVEGSIMKIGTEKKAIKRVSKIEIPCKETKLESVYLNVPLHPFVQLAIPLIRRQVDYQAMWLQTYKLTQTLFDRNMFMSYNPTEVVNFQKDPEVGLSKLQQTVMRTLKFRSATKPYEEEYDYLHDSSSLFDEHGAIKTIFHAPPMKQFKEIIMRDNYYLMEKDLSAKEKAFIYPLEFIVFKKSIVKPASKLVQTFRSSYDTASKDNKLLNTEILSRSHHSSKEQHKQVDTILFYMDSYIRDIHAHLRKLKIAEIDSINRVSSSTAAEKVSTTKILGGMHRLSFTLKSEEQNSIFGKNIGFTDCLPVINNSSKKFKIDRVSRAGQYDDFHIEEMQETDLFIYYTQTNKLLTILSLRLLVASLDLDENETSLLQKKVLPFYTLNNLRLNEVEGLLFHDSVNEDEIENNKEGFPNNDSAVLVNGKVDWMKKLGEEKSTIANTKNFKHEINSAGSTKRDTKEFGTYQKQQTEGNSNLDPIQEVSEETLPPLEFPQNSLDHPSGIALDPLDSTLPPRRPKFAYRRLRNYLYTIKRIELKNRSNSRSIFAFIDEVKSKMAEILENTKLTKPDTVFNTYLNCLFENEQRVFTIALLDSMAQLRWLENFNDLIDINLEKIRQDNQMFYKVRGVLINLLFPKNATFKVFYDLFTNKHLGEESPLVAEAYPCKQHGSVLPRQMNDKKLKTVIRKNNVLNLFEACFLSQTNHGGWTSGVESFNEFSHQDFDNRWDNLFTQLLSFRSPERTFISKKIFEIRLALGRDITMPSESIQPHILWIYKMFDSHRLLDLNLKNLLLFEALNSKVVNDHFCDRQKERSSVVVEDVHLNDVKLEAKRRQIVPSLLPFVSNSMFEKGENYDFSRIVLKIMAMELRLTSSMLEEDLTLERFPDINFSVPPEHNVGNVEVDLRLKKFVMIDSVWSDDPVISHVGDESSNIESRGREEYNPNKPQRPPKVSYSKDVYNRHKLSILKAFVETLRGSWFQDDLAQAYGTNYLLLRELAAQTIGEETVRLKMLTLGVQMKNERGKLLDKLSISLSRQALNTLLASSYILEASPGDEYIAIRKSGLSQVVLGWQQQFVDSVQEELRRRELVYLIKIDDTQLETEANTLNKELLDFYFSHLMSVFDKVVSSRLVMRNSNFITDLDTLARYTVFVNQDADLSYDKLVAQLHNDTRTFLSEKTNQNSRLKAEADETVLNVKVGLISAVETQKEDTLKEIKERTEAIQVDKLSLYPKHGEVVQYQVKVPLYERKYSTNQRRRLPEICTRS